jgi:hypothetical protein
MLSFLVISKENPFGQDAKASTRDARTTAGRQCTTHFTLAVAGWLASVNVMPELLTL